VNERILIVDDEPSIHEVARAYLEREGFIVYNAHDGRDRRKPGRALLTYRRLAIREEQDVAAQFGAEWDAYAARTPRFIPGHHPVVSVVPTERMHASATEGTRPGRP
jgi:hypothetical protein